MNRLEKVINSGHLFGFFCFMVMNLISLNAISQITMQTNLEDSLSTNSEFIAKIKISKGELNNFAKYQMDLPEGVAVEELESRGGTFSFENKKIKIVWVIAPVDTVFTIQFKLITGALSGLTEITQRFSYIEDGNRKEVDANPFKLKIYKASKTERKMISEPKQTNNSVLSSKSNTSVASEQAVASNQNLANQGNYTQQMIAMKQQAMQFRQDSKKAYDLGTKEKTEAEINLAKAEEALKMADRIDEEDRRVQAIQNANYMKDRSIASNAAAEKILSLSRTLEKEAIELEIAIEEQNQQIQTGDTLNPSHFKVQMQTNESDQNQAYSVTGYEYKKVDRLSQKEIQELKQQASQFRNDATDALQVGLKEKELAEKKLQEAEATLKNAEDIKNKSERKRVIARAEESKQKAENDKQTSEKIIILSRTLEENAEEIDMLVEYLQPSEVPVNAPKETENEVLNQKPLTNAEAKFVELEKIDSKSTVFMVQVGAFKNKPDKKILKKLGKYKTIEEDGKYKVLVGPFDTREEATKMKEELAPKGFDGFVVSYEKGKRK